MIEVRQTPEFAEWIEKLRDRAARVRILQRLVRMGEDHLGDTTPLGDGVHELRFHFGAGYRVYYLRREQDGAVIIVLGGGDKDSQQRDIAKARAVAERELLQ